LCSESRLAMGKQEQFKVGGWRHCMCTVLWTCEHGVNLICIELNGFIVSRFKADSLRKNCKIAGSRTTKSWLRTLNYQEASNKKEHYSWEVIWHSICSDHRTEKESVYVYACTPFHMRYMPSHVHSNEFLLKSFTEWTVVGKKRRYTATDTMVRENLVGIFLFLKHAINSKLANFKYYTAQIITRYIGENHSESTECRFQCALQTSERPYSSVSDLSTRAKHRARYIVTPVKSTHSFTGRITYLRERKSCGMTAR